MPRHYYPYRQKYRYDQDRQRAIQHVQAAWELESKYGDLFRAVKQVFFEMHPAVRANVLDEYRRLYGFSAYEYARETVSSWQSGRVKVSGQTMTRLLKLVPKHVPAKTKFEFVKLARKRTLELVRQSEVTIQLQEGEAFKDVLGQCLSAIHSQRQIELPNEFFEIQGWVTAEDAQLMQQLVLDVETEAHRERVFTTVVMLPYVLALRDALPPKGRMRMVINVPTVRYNILFVKPAGSAHGARMHDQEFLTSIQRAESDLSFQKGEITLHEHLLRNLEDYLTPQQVNELRQIAAKEGLNLEALRMQLRVQTQAASDDLNKFQELITQLRNRGTIARASGTFKTASGEITIETKTRPLGCAGSILAGIGIAAVAVCLAL